MSKRHMGFICPGQAFPPSVRIAWINQIHFLYSLSQEHTWAKRRKKLPSLGRKKTIAFIYKTTNTKNKHSFSFSLYVTHITKEADLCNLVRKEAKLWCTKQVLWSPVAQVQTSGLPPPGWYWVSFPQFLTWKVRTWLNSGNLRSRWKLWIWSPALHSLGMGVPSIIQALDLSHGVCILISC